jgi:hypothetical protein
MKILEWVVVFFLRLQCPSPCKKVLCERPKMWGPSKTNVNSKMNLANENEQLKMKG